jgi:hypothetical protein
MGGYKNEVATTQISQLDNPPEMACTRQKFPRILYVLKSDGRYGGMLAEGCAGGMILLS